MIAEGCRNPYKFGIYEGTELHCDASNSSLFLIPDRPTAIRKAFSLAEKNDIVLLLGKAHENSIIYSDYAMPYDEITEASAALVEMGYKEG
jgi:UDP-N-acetylmuramoyl-L-alanyl-D-glutamate--2,6-diaminopimelate ligase